MIRKTFPTATLTDFRGGKGVCVKEELLTPEEFMGHGRLYCKMVVKPGASIGRHDHIGETESFYILSGNGVFTDHDGAESPVRAGEIALIDPDQGHAIANASDTEDLVMLCLILFKPVQ